MKRLILTTAALATIGTLAAATYVLALLWNYGRFMAAN